MIEIVLISSVVLFPILGGVVLIVKSKRRAFEHPVCGGCGYVMTGHASDASVCPECGRALKSVGVIPAGGAFHNTKMLNLGMALLLVGSFLAPLAIMLWVRIVTSWVQ